MHWAQSVAEGVNAAAAVVTALLTGVVAVIAWIQIGTIAKQQAQAATLQACDRYDTDALLDSASRNLRHHLGGGAALGKIDIEISYTSVFNYFDAIAIGIRQGLYIEEIAKEHIGNILDNWMGRLSTTTDPTLVALRSHFISDFPYISALYIKWYGNKIAWLSTQPAAAVTQQTPP